MSLQTYGFLPTLLALLLVASIKGHIYQCNNDTAIAFTPGGAFQRAVGAGGSNCSLTIPKRLFWSDYVTLEIRIEHISTPLGSSCQTEFIDFAGNKYCGGILNADITINISEDINISYNTTSLQPRATFLLNYIVYTDICEPTESLNVWPVVIGSGGTKQSPSCTKVLNVTNYDKLMVSTERAQSPNTCDYRGISVVDDNNQPICQGEGCLTGVGYDITKFSRVSVVSMAEEGCKFYWKFTALSESVVQDICSLTGTSLTLPQGKLSSPGYGKGYEGSVDCSITIAGFEVINLTIMYYKLKKRLCNDQVICNCGDRLIINHSTPKCGRITKSNNRTYVGTELPLSIHLVTLGPRLGSAAGFYLTYTGYSKAMDICSLPASLELTDPILIKSPNFPNQYSSNLNCQVRISLAGSVKVRISLLSFSVEEFSLDDPCRYDYLAVGSTRYCGQKDGQVIEMEGNGITLHFRTDNKTSDQGFYLRVEQLNAPSGNLESSITTETISTLNDSNPAERGNRTGDMELSPTVSATAEFTTSPSTDKRSLMPTTSVPSSQPFRTITKVAQPDKKQEETITYNEVPDTLDKSSEQLVVEKGEGDTQESRSNLSETQNGVDGGASKTCPVPWYYWICSLISVLLAVLITITICLIKLKRLKVAMSGPTYSDTESSRDGLTNPVYYSHTHRGDINENGSHYYTNRDRQPLGSRLIINKNSVQTTV